MTTGTKPILGPDPNTERERWLEWRNTKVWGGSSAPILFGHGRKTLAEHYDEVVGVLEGRARPRLDTETAKFLNRRLQQEQTVADWYVEETGRMIRKVRAKEHGSHPLIVCAEDREILKDGRGVGTLEIKTRNPNVFNSIKLKGFPEADWIQLQHDMMVAGNSWGALCEGNVADCATLEQDFDADSEFHRELYAREVAFIEMVERRERPSEERKDPDRLPVELEGSITVIDNPEIIAAIADWEEAEDTAKEVADLVENHKAYVRRLLEVHGHEAIEFDLGNGNGFRVYYREQNGRATFDKKALAKAHPEIDLKKFEKIGAPSRSLRKYRIRFGG